MTATEPLPARAAAPTDTWSAQLEQLKARYKHVRAPVLVALNILIHNPDVAVDDAKAQAQLHGTRITAASVNAAKTLLSRMDSAPATKATVKTTTSPAPTGPATPRVRRARAPQPALDAEAMIRSVVGKLQAQGSAEVERLRDGIRKAITALQATLG